MRRLGEALFEIIFFGGIFSSILVWIVCTTVILGSQFSTLAWIGMSVGVLIAIYGLYSTIATLLRDWEDYDNWGGF